MHHIYGNKYCTMCSIAVFLENIYPKHVIALRVRIEFLRTHDISVKLNFLSYYQKSFLLNNEK